MRQAVTRALRPLNAIAVENPVLPGTPDVNYVEGWIELKWIRAWPKGVDTVVRIPHYTVQQRIWHIKRRRAGGQAWWMLRCRSEWLLMDGALAAIHVNNATKAELIALSGRHWKTGLDAEDLIQYLSTRQEPYQITQEDLNKMREHQS